MVVCIGVRGGDGVGVARMASLGAERRGRVGLRGRAVRVGRGGVVSTSASFADGVHGRRGTFWLSRAFFLAHRTPRELRFADWHGGLIFLFAWSALLWMQIEFGALETISMLLMIWGADSFAYLIGRKFGRRKLAPNISPNKTIEGALGGLIGAAVVGGGVRRVCRVARAIGGWRVFHLAVGRHCRGVVLHPRRFV